MKSFKQFLAEAPHFIDGDEEDYKDNLLKPTDLEKKTLSKETHIASLSDDHELVHRGNEGGGVFMIRHKRTKTPQIAVWGYKTDDNHFWVENLKKSPRSMYGGHDLYRHMVNHGINIQSDLEQTAGGAATWRKLHKEPTVKVTRHDFNSKEELPVHDYWEDNYETNPDKVSVFRATKKA